MCFSVTNGVLFVEGLSRNEENFNNVYGINVNSDNSIVSEIGERYSSSFNMPILWIDQREIFLRCIDDTINVYKTI